MVRFIALFLLIQVSIACSVEQATDAKLQQYTDPLTGEQAVLRMQEIGPWSIYTYPGDENALIMVTKNGKPVISVSDLDSRMILVHSSNPSLSAVSLIDNEMDGEFDQIDYGNGIFLAQDYDFNGWIDSLSIDGRTLIWVDSQWLELISKEIEGGKHERYVQMESGPKRVVLKDGSWHVEPEKGQ